MSADRKKSKKAAGTNAPLTIGEVAGKVWRHLNAEGPVALSKLARELGEKPDRIAMAIGWLAREDKVTLTVKGTGTRVALKENGASW